MRTRGALVGLGLVAAALSGCSGANAGEPVECETPAENVSAGLTDGSELTPVTAAAVSVPDAGYVIAVEVQVAGVEGTEIGVWESTSLESGPYRSVDGIAQEFTDWPVSDLDAADGVVADAKSCLE